MLSEKTELRYNCDEEPIHAPGYIQPFGFLAVIEPANKNLVALSRNVYDFTGLDCDYLLAGTLDQFMDSLGIRDLEELIEQAQKEKPMLYELIIKHTQTGEEVPLNCLVHRNSQNYIVAEFEHLSERNDKQYSVLFDKFTQSARSLKKANDFKELQQELVREIKKVSGYDRIALYKFNDEWGGQIIAEEVEETQETLLGLHYSPDDLPKQARDLYYSQPVRIIPNTQADDVLISTKSHTAEPADLSKTLLRSVSGYHKQYLSNMGINATLSISVMIDGKLWGLVIGHHYSSHYIGFQIRRLCEVMTDVFSFYQPVLKEKQLRKEKDFLLKNYDKIEKQLNTSGSVIKALTKYPANVMRLIPCDGVYTSIKGVADSMGSVPEPKFLDKLIEWIDYKESDIYCTHTLAKQFKDATLYSQQFSGIMSARILGEENSYIIWFRKETVKTIRWAGIPEKEKIVTEHGLRYQPRKSFETHKEVVYQESIAWTEPQKEVAARLRQCLFDLFVQSVSRMIEINKELQSINKAMTLEMAHRRKAEQSERQARTEAEAANRLKTSFLANMSHEIRIPINGIMGLVSIMEKEYKDRQLHDYLHLIRSSSDRLLTTINSIIDIARIEADEIKTHIKTFDLMMVANEVTALLKPLAEQKSLKIILDKPNDHVFAKADENLTHQILSNLISNAIKFTNSGQVKLSFCNEELKDGSQTACVEVSDTGIGMSKTFLEAIFMPFRQESEGWNRQYQGSGLGLAIAQRYARLMEGQLDVKSELNEGSTFTLKLPAAHKNERKKRVARQPFTTRKVLNILVVEDDEISTIVLEKMLENHQVQWASTDKEALEKFQLKSYHYVLMDINLGYSKNDGVQVMQKMKKQNPKTKTRFIAVTGYAMNGDKDYFIKQGFDSYLAKPYQPEQLAARLH